jgi:hypothetical protein
MDDAWRTKSGSLRSSAIIVSARGRPDRSLIGAMRPAPPVDQPQRWAGVTSLAGCVDAIGAARAWLLRHGDQITAGQIVTTSRAAFALPQFVGYVLVHTDALTDTTPVAQAARHWRGAA